ncbi:MAG TPA: type II toxin-antitoxin system RelE/ParE family toxin [Luteimonas sp.]|nr:type II toxin-antitoxin system RelE/ParE family toxin [Luteimonas sp.]
MTFRIRFTEEAQADLARPDDFLLDRDPPDLTAGEHALAAIAHGIDLLEHSPWSCRKAHPGEPRLRELLIGFGHSGYVALFEIEDECTVTILALRHQREDDYH